ncbi:MAG TPA: methyltransferase [Actinomycetota bacterium]|nr:methyltransferase [Actinomycetota bacterium]
MTEPAQPAVDLRRLTDLCTPWCIHVAATLRIADHIACREDAGPVPVEDLAAAAGCDPRALHAVLGHLVGAGIFLEPEPGCFARNAAARELQAQSPFLDLNGIGGRMAGAWGTLLTYVRTGQPGYREAFGLPFWEDLAAHPTVAASFDALMGPSGHGEPSADVAIAGGWEAVRSVIDVGGGTGSFLAALLRAHPHLHGTLVDLPGTVARASDALRDPALAGRVAVCGQSFFDRLPPGADVYLLRKVLNDWPDAETVRILQSCAAAGGPDGRVVVTGGVVPDDAPRGLSIEMVLLGATHNTLAEFRNLAARAGLQVVGAGAQSSGPFVVECRIF